MITKRLFLLCAMVLAVVALSGVTWSAAGKPNPGTRVARIIQTNSAGDSVDVIDPATNKVVGLIEGIEVNHGAAVAPDGTRIYVSDEAQSTLDVVDAKTLKVTKRIPLTGHPNNVAVATDGKRVYVAIAEAPGGVDVIDTTSLTDIKTLQTKGPIHNPYVTPDGKYVVAGSIRGKSVNVIDTQTDQTAWTLLMDLGVRPMAFARNPDGSTKWIFVQFPTSTDSRSSILRRTKRSIAFIIPISFPENQRLPPAPIRLTAWPSRQTRKRWSSAAGRTTNCSLTLCRI